MKTENLEQRTIEPIVVGNLALDGEAVRGSDGEYLVQTQQEWINHLAGTGARLPTLPEYFAFIHHLQKENHPASEGLLQDLLESWLCTGTRFGYHQSNNTITHLGDETRVIPCAIPEGGGYLDILVKDDDWQKVVQTAFGHPDADEAVEVLQKFSGKCPYLWTPSAESRKATPERAAWFGCDSNLLYLNGYSYLDDDYAVRGVRRVGRCEAPRVENGSAYRTPAKTSEEVLEENIREELSRFNKYVSPLNQDSYKQDVLQALKNIEGLFHGK